MLPPKRIKTQVPLVEEEPPLSVSSKSRRPGFGCRTVSPTEMWFSKRRCFRVTVPTNYRKRSMERNALMTEFKRGIAFIHIDVVSMTFVLRQGVVKTSSWPCKLLTWPLLVLDASGAEGIYFFYVRLAL